MPPLDLAAGRKLCDSNEDPYVAQAYLEVALDEIEALRLENEMLRVANEVLRLAMQGAGVIGTSGTGWPAALDEIEALQNEVRRLKDLLLTMEEPEP